MIGSISGTVRHKDLHVLIVDVGGVGYKIFSTTDTTLEALEGESIFLWTYLAVKENALDLYGFLEKDALEVFESLLSVSGIGPKTALSILNVATPSMLRQAVAEEDTSYLTKVSGIGRKTAEKIVLELRDKFVSTGPSMSLGKQAKADSDVMEALLSLGYAEREVREILKKIPKDLESASDRVKSALKLLSSN